MFFWLLSYSPSLKTCLISNLPFRGYERGLHWEFSVVDDLVCFMHPYEAFKKIAVTLISGNDLRGLSRISLGSWVPLCPGILTKTHVEGARAGLPADLRG